MMRLRRSLEAVLLVAAMWHAVCSEQQEPTIQLQGQLLVSQPALGSSSSTDFEAVWLLAVPPSPSNGRPTTSVFRLLGGQPLDGRGKDTKPGDTLQLTCHLAQDSRSQWTPHRCATVSGVTILAPAAAAAGGADPGAAARVAVAAASTVNNDNGNSASPLPASIQASRFRVLILDITIGAANSTRQVFNKTTQLNQTVTYSCRAEPSGFRPSTLLSSLRGQQGLGRLLEDCSHGAVHYRPAKVLSVTLPQVCTKYQEELVVDDDQESYVESVLDKYSNPRDRSVFYCPLEFFYNRGLQAAAAQLGPSVFTSFSHYAFVFPGRMNATYNLECRDPTTVFVPSIPGVTFFNMGYPETFADFGVVGSSLLSTSGINILARSFSSDPVDPNSILMAAPVCPNAPESAFLQWSTPKATLTASTLPAATWVQYTLPASYKTGTESFLRVIPSWIPPAKKDFNLYMALRMRGGADKLISEDAADKVAVLSVNRDDDGGLVYTTMFPIIRALLPPRNTTDLPAFQLRLQTKALSRTSETITLRLCRYNSSPDDECPLAGKSRKA